MDTFFGRLFVAETMQSFKGGFLMLILVCILIFPFAVLAELLKMNK